MRKAGEGMNWRKKITILLISCFVFGSVILLGVSAGGFIRENAWTRNLIFTRDAESKDGLSDEAKEDSVLSAEEAMPLEAGKTEASEYPIVRLYINGERMDADSYLIEDTTYTPLRAFFDETEDGQAVMDWNNGTAGVKTNALSLSARQGEHYLEVNDRILYHSKQIRNIDSRIYVPVRTIAKIYQFDVEWEGESQSVYLKGEPQVLASGENYYNETDLYWLSRIIQAESGGEPFAGKIAVGNVVMNRSRHSGYPDTIYDVVFDRKHGTQFSPVASGTIYNTPSAESVKAAKVCLEGFSFDEEMIFFLNPRIATNFWIVKNRTYVMSIGNHDFYK